MKQVNAVLRVMPNNPKKGEVATFMFLIEHPMQPGTIKDPKTGKIIPADYITTIKVSLNDKEISTIHNGPGVSSNPIFTIKFKAIESGKLSITYTDNHGNSWSKSTDITVS